MQASNIPFMPFLPLLNIIMLPLLILLMLILLILIIIITNNNNNNNNNTYPTNNLNSSSYTSSPHLQDIDANVWSSTTTEFNLYPEIQSNNIHTSNTHTNSHNINNNNNNTQYTAQHTPQIQQPVNIPTIPMIHKNPTASISSSSLSSQPPSSSFNQFTNKITSTTTNTQITTTNNNNNNNNNVNNNNLQHQHLYRPTTSTSTTPTIITNNNNNNRNKTNSQPKTLHTMTTDQNTWKLFQSMSLQQSREMMPNDERYKAIPRSFTHAMPLEQDTHINVSRRNSFGYPTTVFKVMHVDDGRLYCLRRLDNVRCINHRIADIVTDMWTRAILNNTNHASNTNNNNQINNQNNNHSNHNNNNNKMKKKGWKHHASKLSPSQEQTQTQHARLMDHPGIVTFRKCFHQNRAVFFVHDYYPNAQTLQEYLNNNAINAETIANHNYNNNNNTNNGSFPPLPESILWNFLTQLVTTLRAIHNSGLACRVLDLRHILCTPEVGSGVVVVMGNHHPNHDPHSFRHAHSHAGGDDHSSRLLTQRVRLRINCLGMLDALEYEARKPLISLQQEDIRSLGYLMLSLASGTELTSEAMETDLFAHCDAYVRHAYSNEFHALIWNLISPPPTPTHPTHPTHSTSSTPVGHHSRMDAPSSSASSSSSSLPPPTIEKVCRAVSHHALDALEDMHAVTDNLQGVLAGEYESGRALRLLLKLGFVNERPEFGVDSRWSETGDCYILKLFRDYGTYMFC